MLQVPQRCLKCRSPADNASPASNASTRANRSIPPDLFPCPPVSSPEPSRPPKAFPSCACRGRTSSHAFPELGLVAGEHYEGSSGRGCGGCVEGCTGGTHGVPMARVGDKDDGRLQSLCATLYLRRGASARRRVGCRLQRSSMATRWTLLPTTPGRPAPGVRASSASPRSLLSRDTYLIDGLKRLGNGEAFTPTSLAHPPHPPLNRAAAAR